MANTILWSAFRHIWPSFVKFMQIKPIPFSLIDGEVSIKIEMILYDYQ